MHFSSSVLAILTSLQLAVAAADAQITAVAVLEPRQNSDPSLVGWVSTSGQSSFSVDRSCDYPATLSKSGSYAQCCASTGPCNFYTSCSSGNLLGASTSVFCDQGTCNTGLIVASIGATSAQSFLGCWPTNYGTAPFDLVQNIGTAPVVTTSGGALGSASTSTSGASMTSGASTGSSSSGASAAATTSTSSTGSGNSGTSTTSATTSSTGKSGACGAFSVPSLALLGTVALALALL